METIRQIQANQLSITETTALLKKHYTKLSKTNQTTKAKRQQGGQKIINENLGCRGAKSSRDLKAWRMTVEESEDRSRWRQRQRRREGGRPLIQMTFFVFL